VLSTSMGLLGALPGAFAIHAMAWRMVVPKFRHGATILVVTFLALLTPFLLVSLGVLSPSYAFHDGTIVILPTMHALPPTKALISLVVTTAGCTWYAVMWGRIYNAQIRDTERLLTFQHWQLQQLVPADRG